MAAPLYRLSCVAIFLGNLMVQVEVSVFRAGHTSYGRNLLDSVTFEIQCIDLLLRFLRFCFLSFANLESNCSFIELMETFTFHLSSLIGEFLLRSPLSGMAACSSCVWLYSIDTREASGATARGIFHNGA